jgi:hypothetical protein
MTNLRRRLSPALGLVGMLGSCAPQEEFPLPPVVWEGQSVRVRMDDPDIQVCGGSFEALDRHAELVREALLLEGDGVVEYSIGDQDFVDAACEFPFDESSTACTDGVAGRVFTAIPFIPHEIVHAVRREDPRIGLLSSPFEEGLAMVYGDDILPSWPIPLDILGIIESATYVQGEQEYYYSGHMVAKLLNLHGMEAFRRFDILAVTKDEGTAFAEVFGETKEEFATFAEADPICEQTQWWMPLLECDGEVVTADPGAGTITLAGNLSCAEPDAQGPEYGRMWTSRHFRLDKSTSILSYDVDMPEDATLEIVACEGGCPERVAYLGETQDIGTFDGGIPALEPGKYFLRVSRPVTDQDGSFKVIIY